jgi:hypothetical protein
LYIVKSQVIGITFWKTIFRSATRYGSHIYKTKTKIKAGSKSAISINLDFTSTPVQSVVKNIAFQFTIQNDEISQIMCSHLVAKYFLSTPYIIGVLCQTIS